jgi:hypothetical protein
LLVPIPGLSGAACPVFSVLKYRPSLRLRSALGTISAKRFFFDSRFLQAIEVATAPLCSLNDCRLVDANRMNCDRAYAELAHIDF